MLNPAILLKLKGYWERFTKNHPKLLPFINAAGKHALHDGTVIDIKVTPPEGAPLSYNMRLTPDDLVMIAELQKLLGK